MRTAACREAACACGPAVGCAACRSSQSLACLILQSPSTAILLASSPSPQDPLGPLPLHVCKTWSKEPVRFTLDPTHQMPGLNIPERAVIDGEGAFGEVNISSGSCFLM